MGINLNPDKVCNFDCIYCQVDRTTPPIFREVDLERLVEEARQVLTSTIEGDLYEVPPFAGLPETLRRVNDIAFSGDGEPTSYPEFREAVERIIAVREELGLQAVKLLVITNATLFHRPYVREGLALMDRNNGEIWAKLDAGSEGVLSSDRTNNNQVRTGGSQPDRSGTGATACHTKPVHAGPR